jgi:hypothetical protein
MTHVLRLVLLLFITGCSVKYPVFSKVQNSDEEFMGIASASVSGRGSLAMRSNDGVVCNGEFLQPFSSGMGEGNFTCDDGRSGAFTFYTD